MADEMQMLVPEGHIEMGRILIIPHMAPDGDSLGLSLTIDGNLETMEVLGALRLAEHQYVNGQSND